MGFLHIVGTIEEYKAYLPANFGASAEADDLSHRATQRPSKSSMYTDDSSTQPSQSFSSDPRKGSRVSISGSSDQNRLRTKKRVAAAVWLCRQELTAIAGEGIFDHSKYFNLG